jgi:Ca-activated chloride channel family protein
LSAGAGDIDALLSTRADIGASAMRDDGTDVDSARWKDRGPWLLLALLPLALAGFRRGWLMTFLLAAMFPRADVQAASLTDLWRRPDQQAAAALAAGDAKAAAEVAPTAEWRGSAAYRSGDFAAAESAYANADGADGAYNRGNALANRKAVEEFMKQHKQQDQQNRQGEQNPQQQGQQGQQGEPKDQSKDGAQDQQQQSSQKQTQDGEQGQGAQADAAKDAQDEHAGKPDAKDDARKGASDGDANAQGAKPSDKPDAAQQQALKQAVDRALAGKEKTDDRNGKPGAAHELEDDATREKRQALEHWLERVPDDPGGLLRRKFQLEYQRRQQRGGDGG